VTVPVAYLQSADVELIERELSAKVAQAADLFRDAPLVIDLSEVENESVDLAAVLEALRRQGVLPIAVRSGSAAQLATARGLDLGILQGRKVAGRGAAPPLTAPPPVARERLFTQPVRSGQRVFVPNGDLVVVGQVNTGAEVLASGNIHVYGPLRGRAMAGVTGDTSTRILTTCLEAELVSVAGVYRALDDDVPAEVRAQPAQIFLVGDRLLIEPLALAGEPARKSP
jgi:septum site-determining protein MinC